MTLLAAAARTATALLGFALFAVVGCKPAAAPGTGQSSPPEDHPPQSQSRSVRQPGAQDFTAFFGNLFSPLLKVAELKMDPPTRMPNTSPADNVWTVNVKLTLVPQVDLLSLPSPDAPDVQTINALVNELNALIAWHNAYVRSAYAAVYGAFDLAAPVSTVPQLLLVQQAKGRPLAPIYGKVAAEWQVDHWQFKNMDLPMPELGRSQSFFTGATMVKGSPDAEAFLKTERDAIAQAKTKKDAIQSRYADDLAKAVKPGTIYRGQISHPRGILPCEVRFIDTPGADPQIAMFEVSLPQEPTDRLVYTAKLALEVPLNLPDNAVAGDPFHIPTFAMSGNASNNVPVGNLTVTFVRRSGKATVYGPLPNVLLYGTNMMGMNKPFLLLNRRLQGVVSQFNGDFSLKAQQNP